MAKLVYRGTVETLQGSKWDVPDSVPMNQRAAWIESTAREADLAAAASAEKEAREAEVLAARVEKAKNDASISKITADLEAVTSQLEELSGRIVAEPDVSAQLQFNASAASIYDRSLSLAEEVSAMQATVSELLVKSTAMAEAAAIGEQLQQQALALLTNNQQMMNGSFETYSAELERLGARTNFALVEVQELNTTAQDNRQLIEQAANIKEESVVIAQQEAARAVAEMSDDFMDLMALSLRALGLRVIEISRKANESITKARGENLV